MGCDIHSWAEVRRGGRWVAVTEPLFDPGYGDPLTHEPYSGRNYALFALLADVRNRYDVTPIAPPRGLPVDVSPEVERALADDPDLHTQSWFLLSELLAFDWQQGFELEGVQEEAVYLTGARYPYSASVGGGSVVVIDQDDYPPAGRDPTAHYYVEKRWTETYAETAGDFYTNTIPILQSLSDDPALVRLVFAFDN